MSKKKTRKEEKKISKGFQIELIGILIVLVSIIGLCGPSFGLAGKAVCGFAMFLVGTSYSIVLLLFLILGLYIIFSRDIPNIFNIKLIGLYLIMIGACVIFHHGYVIDKDLEGMTILKETINNLMASFNNPDSIQGGGVIGALFSMLFVWLFSKEGLNLVSIVVCICGAILFTGVTIYDIVNAIKTSVKKTVQFTKDHTISKKDLEHIKQVEDKYEVETTDNSKLVVSNINDIINMGKEETKEEVKDEHVEQEYSEKNEDIKNYILPNVSLLDRKKHNNNVEDERITKDKAKLLELALKHYDIEGKVVAAHVGPAVTQFEVELKPGIKLARVTGISRELALELAAKSINIQAPIPGKNTVGVEIPNGSIVPVTFREVFEQIPTDKKDSKLLAVLGRDIMGEPKFIEVNKTPHLLVAGSTGSGKSVCINSIIVSILMRTKPDEVRLVLVDPKKVEFSMYNCVPHLLVPVITDPKQANLALQKIVGEMDNRYLLFEASGTKNIAGYNAYIETKNKNLPLEEQKPKLPYIVVIIDELADLMMVASKEVESSIQRITQLARAAGIHLIVATQRPSTNVITGVVKANIPTRIAFAVASQIDSRTIIDGAGAEKLLGKGDMFYVPQDENTPIRIQGTFISDDEIKRVADYTIKQQIAKYDNRFIQNEQQCKEEFESEETDAMEEPLYDQIVEFVVTQGKASASLLQRRFRIGYNRASRCIDLLEERGIIGPNNGSKPREVLVSLNNKDTE